MLLIHPDSPHRRFHIPRVTRRRGEELRTGVRCQVSEAGVLPGLPKVLPHFSDSEERLLSGATIKFRTCTNENHTLR